MYILLFILAYTQHFMITVMMVQKNVFKGIQKPVVSDFWAL